MSNTKYNLDLLLDTTCVMPDQTYTFEEVREILLQVKDDLLKITNINKYKELRREVERYFKI